MRQSKVCVITGATSGIGRAAARSLAAEGFHLLLVSRTESKGKQLLEELGNLATGCTPELYIADLSAQSDIRRLANEIRSHHQKIDVLLNNAGGIFRERFVTAEGLEHTFALNHLAYFLLTNLLLDRLTAAGAARVINVSSQAHMIGSIEFDHLGDGTKYNPMKAYAESKLENLLFTYELSRRLSGTEVTVNALHPGGVRTNFGRDLSGPAGFFFRRLDFLLRSPEKGAETALWLATSVEVARTTGKYFKDKKEIRSSRVSYDRDVAGRLWDASARFVGLAAHDRVAL